MNRREVIVGAGAVALATQVPMALASEKKKKYAYTVYRDYDMAGRSIHYYRGRKVKTTPEFEKDVKDITGVSFDDFNRWSTDFLLDDKTKTFSYFGAKEKKVFWQVIRVSGQYDHLKFVVTQKAWKV